MTAGGTAFAATTIGDHMYISSVIPPYADMEVAASIVLLDLRLNNFNRIGARVSHTADTGYFAVAAMRSNGERVVSILKRIATVNTTLAVSDFITTWEANVPKELKIIVSGSQITAQLDGVTVATATDTDITDAGRIAIGGSQNTTGGAATLTAGVHFTSITAQTIAAPPPVDPPSDITFTPATVDETAPAGTTVGTFA